MIADSGLLLWRRRRSSRCIIRQAVEFVSCVAGLSCSLSWDADDASSGQLPQLQHNRVPT